MRRTCRHFFGLLLTALAAAGCTSAATADGRAPDATADGSASAAAPVIDPTLPNPPTFTFPSIPTLLTGDSVHTLSVDGYERTYLLHVPSGIRANSPVPLVLVFHGHWMNAESMLATTKFNDIADAHQFLAVYPNGTGSPDELSFNAGECCGSAEKNKIDDVKFVRGILADLQKTFAIDPARVYAMGFSNGAIFSYRLACEMSDVFAAIAPVAGNIMFGPCRPQDRVSLIHIQGLSDTSAPFSEEERGPDFSPVIFSVQGSVAFWAVIDGCSELPAVDQEGVVTHAVYSSCAGGTSVELYSLKGIGHTWPPESVFPASQTIWDFFAAHPKE